MTSTLLVIVLAPMPKPMPATRKISVMMKIRLSMNGELPMIDAGLRVAQRGARQDGEQGDDGRGTASVHQPGEAQATGLARGDLAASPSSPRPAPCR